jgi:hypothetical protein
MRLSPLHPFVLFALALAGCAAPASNKDPLPTEEDPATEAPSKKKGTTLQGSPTPGQPESEESGEEARSYVFAHDPRVLYRLAPSSTTFTKIGELSCLRADESVVDMAVSANGAAYATTWSKDDTYSRFLKFDPLTAKCTEVAESKTRSYPNSLSFVPKGTVDPKADALVGYENTEQGTKYLRIDLATGAMTDIGWLQTDYISKRVQCSGDLVALDGDKAYLTVHPEDDSSEDELVEVNPTTGAILKRIGKTGHKQLWGLAYWQSKAWAFSGSGEVISIDLATGRGTAQTLGGLPSAFYGAAVSTVAPH